MKIKNLQKQLKKLVKKELGADGYVRLDVVSIELDSDGNTINLIGAYGIQKSDGSVLGQNGFNLRYPDGKEIEFVKGMFYQLISTTDFNYYEVEVVADGNTESESKSEAADGEII